MQQLPTIVGARAFLYDAQGAILDTCKDMPHIRARHAAICGGTVIMVGQGSGRTLWRDGVQVKDAAVVKAAHDIARASANAAKAKPVKRQPERKAIAVPQDNTQEVSILKGSLWDWIKSGQDS